jgi:hypothetical protein
MERNALTAVNVPAGSGENTDGSVDSYFAPTAPKRFEKNWIPPGGNAMSLKLLLTLAGGLEILAGFTALIIPAPVVSLLLGRSMDPIVSVLARLFDSGGRDSG